MISEQTQFAQRLSEVIAWCAQQQMEIDTTETAEFHERKRLWTTGADLYNRGNLLKQRKPVHRWLMHHLSFGPKENTVQLIDEGRKLMRAGDVTDILPLNKLLRTAELAPEHFVESNVDRLQVVDELALKRENILCSNGFYPKQISTNLANGKLLAYRPDENVSDGASQHESKGFFDPNDAPPWDCWISYADGTLVSWVPPDLLRLAQSGIDVNCVDCIRWADAAQLNKLGFIAGQNWGSTVRAQDVAHP